MTYFLGQSLEEFAALKEAIPFVFIAILYFRYETKIENLSMDLLSVEERLEEMSKGEWEPYMRFRKDPYNPS